MIPSNNSHQNVYKFWLADFAAYLANAESEAATQELLAIPGLLERIKQNQATPQAQYTAWRTIRSDV